MDMSSTELYNLLRKKIGVKPIKMKDLAAKCGIVDEGEPVGANNAARMRVQLKKLSEAGLIVIDSERATTTYRKKKQSKTKA